MSLFGLLIRPKSTRLTAWRHLSPTRLFSIDIVVENVRKSASGSVLVGRPSSEVMRFETSPLGGHWAMQADGSCLCSSGSTHVLATVVCNTLEIKRTEDGGLPLQVDYSEGAYARGQVPDHASKRDRQGDREVLISRAMDRALRPLFRPGFSYETHVCAQALSRGGSEVDDRDAVEAMAINSASAAIMSSRVISSHFAGPIGAVLVVKGPDGRFVVSGGSGSQESRSVGRGPSWLHGVDSNSNSQTVLVGSGSDYRSKFRLLYAGTADKAVMVEMEADQASGLELVEAMSLAQSCVADIVKAQLSIAASARKLDEKTTHSAQAEGKEGTPTEEAVKEDEMGVMFEITPVTIEAQGEFKRHLPLVGASHDTVETVEREGKELIMAALERGAGLDKAGRSREVMRIKHKLAALTGLTSASKNKGCGVGESDFDAAFDIILSQCMRELCIVKGLRVDGRALDEIRPLLCDPSPLPSSFSNKVHGSALFGRGETRTLCMAAVGNLYTDPVNLLSSYMTEEQRVKQRDNLMLHYEFPPWATHETGMVSGRANRREVGHGALALKALRPLMPDFADFSFLTRIVAKTTSSNGSSSMAAVCGGSLALKMAGVPIAGLVAGISVGLLSERWPAPLTSISGGAEGRDQEPWPQEMGLHSGADDGNGLYQPVSGNGCNYGRQSLILDIQGMEDGMGDMDLKVAGTRKGLTAIQLDIKLPGIPLHLLNEGIKLARSGLEKILDQMEATISKQSDKIDPSVLGPQHKTHQLTPDLIVPLVGEKGESIASLQERSGAVISAKVDGEVQVAMLGIRAIQGTDLEEGQSYFAKVHEILDYGAVLEMTSGARHLLPLREISPDKLRGDIREVLSEGQVLKVKCLGRDNRGLVVLSCWRQSLPSSLSGSWSPLSTQTTPQVQVLAAKSSDVQPAGNGGVVGAAGDGQPPVRTARPTKSQKKAVDKAKGENAVKEDAATKEPPNSTSS